MSIQDTIQAIRNSITDEDRRIVNVMWMRRSKIGAMSGDDRGRPFIYESSSMYHGPVVFACSRLDLGTPVFVDATRAPDHHLATAVMDFTMWWSRDVLANLNGWSGWGDVEWRIKR